MEINIIRTDFSYLISEEKKFWNTYLKRHLSFFLILTIVGFFFLLDAIDVYSKTNSFNGITFSLAFGFLLSAIINILYPFIIRRKSLLKTKEIVELYKKDNDSLAIKITGWGITTKGLDNTCEFAWQFFEGYEDLSNSLQLIPKHHSFQPIFLYKVEMPVEKYSELTNFLSNKFKILK